VNTQFDDFDTAPWPLPVLPPTQQDEHTHTDTKDSDNE